MPQYIDNNDIVISTQNLTKVYKLYSSPKLRLKEALHPGRKKFHKDFYALNNVSVEINRGEVVGIVGKNGSGKSTFLKILSKVLTPTSGEFMVKGKVSSLLELGSGFNPELTGIENIYFYGTILGFSEEKIKSKLNEIIKFADIGEFIYQPLKTYSSGMKSRLAFSVAINVEPDVLILDEVLSVGDELFRRKCYAKMEGFFEAGITTLFVSHSIPSINEICTRTILLHNGRNILNGPSKLVTKYYQKLLYASGKNINYVLDEIKEINEDPYIKKNYSIKLLEKETTNSKNESHIDSDYLKIISKKNLKTESVNIDTTIPYYIEEFKPKSTLISNPHDTLIVGVTIKTENGEVVNQLVNNKYYYLNFVVKFSRTFENVNVGASFKDEKGKILSGLSVRYSEFVIPKVASGDMLKCVWKFKCVFSKGIYYVDIGVNQSDKEYTSFILKCDDIINFKIIEKIDKDFNNWGVINMNIEPKIIHLKA